MKFSKDDVAAALGKLVNGEMSLRDHGSHPSHKALAKKYLRMIKRGESPDDSVVYP